MVIFLYDRRRLPLVVPLLIGQLITDVTMPGTDGHALLQEVIRRRPLVPVILMTGYGDVTSAVAAMKAGAFDYLQKPIDHDKLQGVVAQATARLVANLQRDHAGAEAAQKVALLSAREREVLSCLAAGKSNKVIAYDLGLSIRTVEMHRVRMMRRLAVRGLPDALRLAHLAELTALN